MQRKPTFWLVVAAAIQGPDGRFLMHRRPPHKRHGGLWEFPGGKVEPGEVPANGLIREIDEELGLSLRKQDLQPLAFAESEADGDVPGIVILLYTARVGGSDQPVSLEGGETGWFAPEDIAALPMPSLDRALLARLHMTQRCL